MGKELRRYFISLIVGLLIVILISGVILFSTTMQEVYLTQMEQTNKNLVEQINSSFEMVIMQVAGQVNKMTIYENKITELVHNRNQKVANYIELYEDLKQIVMGNQYIHSAYLYSQEEQIFFDSESGNSFKKESFFDQAVMEGVNSKYLTAVSPHLVRNKILVYSLIVPLKEEKPVPDRIILCVNIDMGRLYKDIMRKNRGDKEVRLYVYDDKNRILISDDFKDLGEDIAIKQKDIVSFPSQGMLAFLNNKTGIMDAVTYSNPLNCYFYIQVPFILNLNRMFNNYIWLFVMLFLVAAAFIIAYIIIGITTRPIEEVLTDYNDKLLKEMLLSSAHVKNESQRKRTVIEKYFKYGSYSLLLIDISDTAADIAKTVSSIINELPLPGNMVLKYITIHSSRGAVICNYSVESAMEQFEHIYLRQFYQKINEKYYQHVYIAVSSGKTDPSLLYTAYMECSEIQEYKLSISEHITNYRRFKDRKEPVVYPVELEKQLINNLLVKNTEGCLFYTDKFLNHILEKDGLLSDIQIKNYIYQLQNEILTRISSLPVSIKTSGSSDLKNINSRSQIRDMLLNFIQSICTELSRKNTNNASVVNEAILEYINANLTENDFNLNSLSYQFNLNRNYLAKLIKEETSYGFNDYVNSKKIALAKELLAGTALTVEEIAHRTGFSYAHYFIKVFKNFEGITPGQFREMQTNNNNA